MLNVPKSIIVYRNPYEAQLYESGLLFPIIIACAALFCAVIASNWVVDRFAFRSNIRTLRGPIMFASGGLAFLGTLWLML